MSRTDGRPSSPAEGIFGTASEQVAPGTEVSGVAGQRPVDVVPVKRIEANFLQVTYRHDDGRSGQAMLGRDVVVPTAASGPTAVVVGKRSEKPLGSGLQPLRPHSEQPDPGFLAGVRRHSGTTRAATTKSSSHLIDVRRVELSRLPLGEQRQLVEVFSAFADFGAGLDDAAQLGRRFGRTVTDALVSGRIEPGRSDT